jgi:hypothetical protein
MATIPDFVKVPPSNIEFKPVRTNEGGKGKTVYMDMKPLDGGKATFASRFLAGPKGMRVAWPVRPKMDVIDPGQLQEHDKMDIELEMDPERHADFVAQLHAYDAHILQTAFDKRVEWFGKDKAADIDDPRMLRMNYKPLVHKGKERKGEAGGFYNSTIKLKLEKQVKRIKEFVLDDTKIIKGKPTTVVKDVVWHPRLVDGGAPLDPNEPKFFLCYGKDASGVDLYTAKVPLLDAKGSILRNEAGKPVLRYVGPEDIKRGCTAFPIFQINKTYIVESFGPMMTISQLYITPAPQREQPKVEDANVVEDVDPEVAARAMAAMYTGPSDNTSENFDKEEEYYPEDDDLPAGPITVSLEQDFGNFGGNNNVQYNNNNNLPDVDAELTGVATGIADTDPTMSPSKRKRKSEGKSDLKPDSEPKKEKKRKSEVAN